jgi:Domain of unknown function (DUF4326)
MIYIENKKAYKGVGVYIGRPSVLGNPFTHLKGKTLAKFTVATREESVRKYEEYFREKLFTDNTFKKEIESLKKEYLAGNDIHLICWCSPLSCHGDIIKKYLEVE